jgi:FdhD protein
MTAQPAPYQTVERTSWRKGEAHFGGRAVPEETAVAFSYNRLGFAVMMATPADLEDFALGFSISEQVISAERDIDDLEVIVTASGIELRMWIGEAHMAALTARRRRIAGPTGCGLCGIESLTEATRPPPRVTADARLSATALLGAMNLLPDAQVLNARTRAVHAAGFWHPESGLIAVREDVGRHNALDKLSGALSRAGVAPQGGAVLMTSRVSVELVQKAAVLGAPVLVAVSAPTALALRAAEAAGITVAGIARSDGFDVFTRPERILLTEDALT